MRYGPVSYFELNRVAPRDELRRPFGRVRRPQPWPAAVPTGLSVTPVARAGTLPLTLFPAGRLPPVVPGPTTRD